MTRPPCWQEGQPCPNPCAAALHDRIAHNLTPLHGPWTGWRLAGRDLITPDGVRLSPERVRGLAWRQEAEDRLSALKARKQRVSRSVVTLLRINAEDWHRDRFGSVVA